jgi:hypothetical protein
MGPKELVCEYFDQWRAIVSIVLNIQLHKSQLLALDCRHLLPFQNCYICR